MRHPAVFTEALLPVMAEMLKGSKYILDPFAGTGKIMRIRDYLGDVEISGVEIEPEWAEMTEGVQVGNALSLPFFPASFDAVCTSPSYGNRMADHFVSKKPRAAKSYRDFLGRDLSKDSSGFLQWGKRYCQFHVRAWLEVRRVLMPGGILVLNIKDHIRSYKRQRVSLWHILCLRGIGFEMVELRRVKTPSHGFGANRELRIPYENVIKFRLAPSPAAGQRLPSPGRASSSSA